MSLFLRWGGAVNRVNQVNHVNQVNLLIVVEGEEIRRN